MNFKFTYLTERNIDFINYRIKQYNGVLNLIRIVLKELDATLILADGSRPRQTNSFIWKSSNEEFKYLYKLLEEENTKADILKDLINQYNTVCENNIEFEKVNPPIVYKKHKTKCKITKTSKVNENREHKVKRESKVKKETIAERKAKLLNSKTISFAFGLKKDK